MHRKSKAGQNVVKIWVCADTETSFVLELQAYPDITDDKRDISQGIRVVMIIVETRFGSWKCVTVYKVSRQQHWLKDASTKKVIKITDTKRFNKREIPQEFLPHFRVQIIGKIFGYTDNVCCCLRGEKKRKRKESVILLPAEILTVRLALFTDI